MGASGIIKNLQTRAEAKYGATDGDYIGEDGLLYCGKCRTLKQCRVRLPLGGEWTMVEVSVPCKCKQAETEAAERQRRAEEREMIVGRLYRASLIAQRDKAKTFGTSEKSGQMAICKGYAQRFHKMLESGQGLLLWGDTGTGKTHAALCIANALLQDCVSVLMVSVPEVLRTQDIDWLYDRIQRVRLLILDDLGAERGTEYATERVYDVVDTRYRAGFPMICTSNLSIAEMQSAADIRQRRIYERVLETCYPVQFVGARRRTIARGKFAEMRSLLDDAQN